MTKLYLTGGIAGSGLAWVILETLQLLEMLV